MNDLRFEVIVILFFIISLIFTGVCSACQSYNFEYHKNIKFLIDCNTSYSMKECIKAQQMLEISELER